MTLENNNNNIIEQVNEYLLKTEQFSNDFLPLQQILTPVKNDLYKTLEELKQKSETSTELSDKIFYLNRYADLVKKIDSIIEARSKRLQQSLYMLSKLSLPVPNSNDNSTDSDNLSLAPEKVNEIIKILQQK